MVKYRPGVIGARDLLRIWPFHLALQLTPGATLTLFRAIGEHVRKPEPHDHELVKCPKCKGRLRRTQDLQRNTRFTYFRCPNDHGRLTTFFEFLKEKDFIRPLSPQQIVTLPRAHVVLRGPHGPSPLGPR